MKSAGCEMIFIGFENCIPDTLIKIKKTSNPEWYITHYEKVLKWCYDANINIYISILTGFPWDTVEDIRKIREYISKNIKYVTSGFMGGILQPLPNTEIYDKYAKEYDFENWWLYREPVIKDRGPFFKAYYHVFWEQLQNNFFNLDKKVVNEIDKLYRFMGKWNLWCMVKLRFKNPVARYSLFYALLILSKFSLFLYNLSPILESKLMSPITKLGYRFKFKASE